ncbi:MAG: lytic transglycosylase [Ilumatobacteraceae bacterium]|nr:lytic transglycosylase [Ilumatobacteraceae bacterium]
MVPATQAIAGVDTRILAIRTRIARLTGGAPAASGSTSTPTTVAFDPFGVAYQQALDGITPSAPPTTGNAPSAGFDTASGARTEAVAVRVPGRATRVSPTSDAPRAAAPGALSGAEVAHDAYNAGFRGEDLVKVVAIAKRESNWKPGAFNGNTATQDRSYGLMQINMLGDLSGARLQQFGITSNEQLLDAQTNLNAAFTLYTRAGNKLTAWGGYKGQSDTFGTDLGAARQVVIDAGLDPGAAPY